MTFPLANSIYLLSNQLIACFPVLLAENVGALTRKTTFAFQNYFAAYLDVHISGLPQNHF